MTRAIGLASLGLALVLAGCNEYVYRPEENATAQMRGHTAARYDIPKENPQGDVRVASYGIVKVTTEREPKQKTRMMHVRMVIENNSTSPWEVDTRELRVDVHGAGQVAPAFVRSDVQGLPMVDVPPRGKRTLDLFFPLPPEAQKARKLPEFDFTWQVRTPEKVVAERTPFERLEVVPYYAAYGPYWGWGWGPYGWYSPYFGPAMTIGYPGWYW